MGAGPVIESLRELVECGLVEHDNRARIIRLTTLPDRGERPNNGRTLKMFWKRWCDYPESPLKYRHVELIRWLTEPFTDDHSKMWAETFGTVDNSLIESGAVDNDGMQNSSKSSPDSVNGQTDMFTRTSDTVSDTVCDTVSDTNRKRLPVTVSGIPETGGGAGGDDRKRSHNCLPPSFTVKDLLDALQRTAADRVAVEIYDERIGERLWDLVRQCDLQKIGIPEIELAGEWLAAGGLGYRDDLDAKWLSWDGNLLGLVAKASKWDSAGRPSLGGGKRRGGSFDRQADRLQRLRVAEAAP
jgi:hypothetical protein